MANHDTIVPYAISMNDDANDDHANYEYDCHDERTAVRHVQAMFQPIWTYRCHGLADCYIRSNKVLVPVAPNIHSTISTQVTIQQLLKSIFLRYLQ